MPLTKDEIAHLLEVVGQTADQEIDCEECLLDLAEFAERELLGRSVPESLAAVAQHLAVCAECREEYEALRTALETDA